MTENAAPAARDYTDAELIAAMRRSVELGYAIEVTDEWLAAQRAKLEAEAPSDPTEECWKCGGDGGIAPSPIAPGTIARCNICRGHGRVESEPVDAEIVSDRCELA